MTTPTYGIVEWAAAQASPWVPHNQGLRILEAAARAQILDRDLTAPPGTCADGDCYLVAAPATGDWTGQDGKMAVAVGTNATGGWLYINVATDGQILYVVDEALRIMYASGSWTTIVVGATGTAATLDFDVDDTLAANSDALLPTQQAVKAYVDTAIAGVTPSAVTTRVASGTADTLVLADAGNIVEYTNAAAIAVTVPTNASVAYAVNDVVEIHVMGAGTVTVAGDSGVTVRSRGSVYDSAGQYAVLSLTYKGSDTWLLVGDLA